MGLTLSRFSAVEAVSMSYANFRAFREKVAQAIDLDLGKMQGYGGDEPWDKKHPLYAFFWHSDCDGQWSYEDCCAMEPILRQVVEAMEDDELKDIVRMMRAIVEGEDYEERMVFR